MNRYRKIDEVPVTWEAAARIVSAAKYIGIRAARPSTMIRTTNRADQQVIGELLARDDHPAGMRHGPLAARRDRAVGDRLALDGLRGRGRTASRRAASRPAAACSRSSSDVPRVAVAGPLDRPAVDLLERRGDRPDGGEVEPVRGCRGDDPATDARVLGRRADVEDPRPAGALRAP